MKRFAWIALIAAAVISLAVNAALVALLYDASNDLSTVHYDMAVMNGTLKEILSSCVR